MILEAGKLQSIALALFLRETSSQVTMCLRACILRSQKRATEIFLPLMEDIMRGLLSWTYLVLSSTQRLPLNTVSKRIQGLSKKTIWTFRYAQLKRQQRQQHCSFSDNCPWPGRLTYTQEWRQSLNRDLRHGQKYIAESHSAIPILGYLMHVCEPSSRRWVSECYSSSKNSAKGIEPQRRNRKGGKEMPLRYAIDVIGLKELCRKIWFAGNSMFL